jgi:hypothetical protein
VEALAKKKFQISKGNKIGRPWKGLGMFLLILIALIS